MAVSEKEELRAQWQSQFTAAAQYDQWGQVVEAQEGYQAIARVIAAKQGMPSVTSSEKDTMHRLVLCLSARVQALQDVSVREAISASDMKTLEPIFETLFTGMAPPAFPIEAHKFQRAMAVQPDTEGEIICADRDEHYSDWHHSQAALSTVSGTVVSIRIDKIGLKDAQTYIDPFMTVLVADPESNILDTQDIPLAKERRAQYVVFEHQLYLNVSYEDMMRRGAALFFQFKHYKPKKKKVSERCWCFMELDELKRDEEVLLELYQKPTDLKKKKLKLHTEKTLYLHIFATFIRP